MSERSWPMAPIDDPRDAEVLEQAEPEFSMAGRCERCLRYLRADGRCDCEAKE